MPKFVPSVDQYKIIMLHTLGLKEEIQEDFVFVEITTRNREDERKLDPLIQEIKSWSL